METIDFNEVIRDNIEVVGELQQNELLMYSLLWNRQIGDILITDEQNECVFSTHLCRNATEEEKTAFLNKVEDKYKSDGMMRVSHGNIFRKLKISA